MQSFGPVPSNIILLLLFILICLHFKKWYFCLFINFILWSENQKTLKYIASCFDLERIKNLRLLPELLIVVVWKKNRSWECNHLVLCQVILYFFYYLYWFVYFLKNDNFACLHNFHLSFWNNISSCKFLVLSVEQNLSEQCSTVLNICSEVWCDMHEDFLLSKYII